MPQLIRVGVLFFKKVVTLAVPTGILADTTSVTADDTTHTADEF